MNILLKAYHAHFLHRKIREAAAREAAPVFGGISEYKPFYDLNFDAFGRLPVQEVNNLLAKYPNALLATHWWATRPITPLARTFIEECARAVIHEYVGKQFGDLELPNGYDAVKTHLINLENPTSWVLLSCAGEGIRDILISVGHVYDPPRQQLAFFRRIEEAPSAQRIIRVLPIPSKDRAEEVMSGADASEGEGLRARSRARDGGEASARRVAL